MKYLHVTIVLIAVILLLLSDMVLAQESASDSPPPIININNNHIQYGNGEMSAIGYGQNSSTSAFVSMPIPTGTPFTNLSNFVFPGTDFATSMVKGGDDKYYLTTSGKELYQFEPGTGQVSLLGSITISGTLWPNGISYNPANGLYYLMSGNDLFSFDITSREARLIGPLNTGGVMIDLCFDINGVCYAYNVLTDNAYTINLISGEATLLGPLGYDAHFAQGMAYDYETGTIYLSAFNLTTYTSQLRAMDPATGMTILLVDWGFQPISAFALDTNPLPVELTSFTASSAEGIVTLNWTTASELNNRGFEVQKMIINEFYSIGFVNGYGTTTEYQSYSFVDKNVSPGINSYRLKQVDFDGTIEYSNVVDVNAVPVNYVLNQNYPNPFNPGTTISWQSPVGSWQTLKIYDVLGNEVAVLVDEFKEAGTHSILFDASGLSTGIYLYKLTAGEFTLTKKLILIK